MMYLADEVMQGINGIDVGDTSNALTVLTEKFLGYIVAFINDVFGSLGLLLTDFSGNSSFWGDTNSGLDYMSFIERYTPIFISVGYVILILCLGINVIHSGIQYELMTARGGVKIVGQLLLGKLLIDLSVNLCTLFIGWCDDLMRSIVSSGMIALESDKIYNLIPETVNIPLIGGVINLFWSIVALLPLLLMLLAVGVSAFAVTVKLILRTFQIAALISVSPVFFACSSADAKRQYFMKWLNIFMMTSFEIVFMALVYAMGTEYLKDNSFFTNTSWSVVAIAMCMMMVRPPQFLKGLVS